MTQVLTDCVSHTQYLDGYESAYGFASFFAQGIAAGEGALAGDAWADAGADAGGDAGGGRGWRFPDEPRGGRRAGAQRSRRSWWPAALAGPSLAPCRAGEARGDGGGDATDALAADVAARVTMARAHLGEKAPSAIVGEAYALVGAPPCAGFGAAAETARKAVLALVHERFTRGPREGVTVYVFCAAEPYQAYCARRFAGACPSPDGFYEPQTREAFVDASTGPGSLVHELVHPLLQDDFPGAPAWFDEGLASLFERPEMPKDGEIHGATNWRRPRLVRALTSPVERSDAGLGALFGMTDEAFRAAPWTCTTPPRAIRGVARREGCLWPFYRAWRAAAADDPRGDKAFAKTLGRTPEQAEADWEAWVLHGRLPAPPRICART